MSARWRRTSKNRKWLDLNEINDKKPKTPQTMKQTKTVPTHSNFRPSKSFAKKALPEQKPLIDIFQENNTVTIVAEIVGFNKDSLKINVKDQKLTLSAKSKDRRYYKSLNLPTLVIPNAMHTKFKNGVLEIKLKKAETLDKEADQNAA
jgi:HSP20 family molecular chaperone IbpA